MTASRSSTASTVSPIALSAAPRLARKTWSSCSALSPCEGGGPEPAGRPAPAGTTGAGSAEGSSTDVRRDAA